MALGKPDRPPNVLVLDALGRIERSALFRNAEILRKILRLSVEGTLAGKPPLAKEIAAEIWTPDAFERDPEGLGIRVQAKTVRKRLREYKETNGATDVVWIDLPSGAYEADLSYNPNSEVMKHMARAEGYRAGLVFFDEKWTRGAFYEVWEVLEKEPRCPLTYPGLVEDWTLFCVIHDLVRGYPSKYTLEKIYRRDIVTDIANKAVDECESYLVFGGIQTLGRSWDIAKQNFEHARKIDAVKTDGSLWYALFLLLTGEVEGALERSKAKLELHPERDDVRMCHVLFLFLTRSYEEMTKHIQKRVTGTHEVNSVAALLSAYASISRGSFGEALEVLTLAQTKTFDFVTEWSHLGAEVYCHTRLAAERIGDAEAFAGTQAELHRCFDLYEKYPALGGLQRMFMYKARGSGARAISALRSACLAMRPGALIGSALWYWPFLDEYRDHPRFARLAKRLNIPEAQRIASQKIVSGQGGASI